MKQTFSKQVSLFFCVVALLFASCVTGSEQKSVPSTAPVTFSVRTPVVDDGTSVTLATQTAGATIYYTMDGSTPTASSPSYTAPLIISGHGNDVIVVKAFACCVGLADSPVTTIAYQIKSAAENTALYLGNPSSARADVALTENYLLERSQYSLSYNSTTLIPNWVAWHLCSSDMGNVQRKNSFKADPLLPALW